MSGRCVLKYHDAYVTASDMDLVAPPAYLNDTLINVFQCFTHQEVFRAHEAVRFLDPTVASCLVLQCGDPEDMEDMRAGLSLRGDQVLFVPVSDRRSLMGSASHWSLLVFDPRGRVLPAPGYRHYDSSGGYNAEAAGRMAAALARLLECDDGVLRRQEAEDVAQQGNGFDCGAFVMAHGLALGLSFLQTLGFSRTVEEWWPAPVKLFVEDCATLGVAAVRQESVSALRAALPGLVEALRHRAEAGP